MFRRRIREYSEIEETPKVKLTEKDRTEVMSRLNEYLLTEEDRLEILMGLRERYPISEIALTEDRHATEVQNEDCIDSEMELGTVSDDTDESDIPQELNECPAIDESTNILSELIIENTLVEESYRFSLAVGRSIRVNLLQKLNGLTDLKEVMERLDTFFFAEATRNWKDFTESIDKTCKYLQVIDALNHSETVSEIADEVGIDVRLVNSWIRDLRIPPLLQVISSIPRQPPEPGKKWLPFRAKARKFSKFIQVPTLIENEADVLSILHQIEPIDAPWIRNYESAFGHMETPHALMYLLGLYISDGSPFSHSITQSVGLVSSLKYPWCDDIGLAFRYSLAKVGIRSKRIRDKIYTNDEGEEHRMHQWLSSTSPLLSYLGEIVLGIGSQSKVDSELNIDWVESIPHEWRIRLLQGIADGDGFVSNNWYVGISSKNHRKPITQLLQSLGIHSNDYSSEVRISRLEDIQKVQSYMFLHATSRRKELKDLVIRMENSRNTHYTEEEIQLILRLRATGLSYAKISLAMWEQLKISRRPAGIMLKCKKLGSMTLPKVLSSYKNRFTEEEIVSKGKAKDTSDSAE